MSKNGSIQTSSWPIPKIRFILKWENQEIAFQEVSGLDAEDSIEEYRHGDPKSISPIKMPGLQQFTPITLKKGVFQKNNKFWDWYNQIQLNDISPKSLTISLLDEKAEPLMVWKLRNAYPIKVGATDLKSEGNEVAIESLEIMHEGISREK